MREDVTSVKILLQAGADVNYSGDSHGVTIPDPIEELIEGICEGRYGEYGNCSAGSSESWAMPVSRTSHFRRLGVW